VTIRERAALVLAALSLVLISTGCASQSRPPVDWMRELQVEGIRDDRADIVHWGPDPASYVSWKTHTNRLVPVYSFGTAGQGSGIDLTSYTGANSAYRNPERLAGLYGRMPDDTIEPRAGYMDLADVAAIQRAGAARGKRYVFVVIFDGMDWQTLQATAVYVSGVAGHRSGRGDELHLQRYDAHGTAQFAYAVTSPADARHRGRVDSQQVIEVPEGPYGGYDPRRGGLLPWAPGDDPRYVTGWLSDGATGHAVTDSAAAATAIFSGNKTYNGAVNVDDEGRHLTTVAREVQAAGFAVGLVTSVPISHATIAGAYANGVSRYDYQDLSRDLLGLASVSHPRHPLPGVDVLIGCGYGDDREADPRQGSNFVPGNRYVTDADLDRIDSKRNGAYVLALRTAGADGGDRLAAAAAQAAREGQRLLGIYGSSADAGHLPYRTADGDFGPVAGHGVPQEVYTEAELAENPTLAEMTEAALEVLASRGTGFWLLVEAGDVDWAAHDANLDSAIGAVLSGDDAVRVVTEWVEAHSNWQESLMVVTADHGHYLVIVDPEGLSRRRR
jgi:alkaline phosphatase